MLDRVPTAGRGVAADLTESVLRRFMRGGTWPGLAREIAWQAVRSTGAEDAWLGWLSELVEQRLAQFLEALEPGVARACATAGLEHLRSWPHDIGGGETAAVLGGREHAASDLARVYVETLDWAKEVVGKRTKSKRRRRGLLTARPPAHVEPPAIVSELIEHASKRYGWAPRPNR